MASWLFGIDGAPHHALLRRVSEFGFDELDLLRPPGRFWADGAVMPPSVRMHMDARRATQVLDPVELHSSLPAGDTWRSMTRRSIARLQAWFLIAEDPQRRLEAKPIETLAHQASLVQHVLQEQGLRRVLIADEVGLGKTVEAGLVIQQLLSQQPGMRILYLAPAKLVSNVQREFRKLGLDFRSWTSGEDSDARLRDARIVASIHRAIHPSNFEEVVGADPWDVIVIDECHHLSAWGVNQTNPVQKYKLAARLLERLSPSGRLILMSGTPHQGHPERFKNLLALLRADGESDEAVAGRVIYRIKDDVQDWDGRPLFPQREVRAATVLDLGPAHQAWLRNIHDFFEPTEWELELEARRRAAGWRCGMALQWATSSVEAGLGFLVRQAIRAGWRASKTQLREAIQALRPYRGGAPDEGVEALYDRVARDIGRQGTAADVEDVEEVDDASASSGSGWTPDPHKLGALLDEGVSLLNADRDAKWREIDRRILVDVGAEKVVLFAQPIETVTALCRYLEERSGRRPSVIIGGQEEDERRAEIDAFWNPEGPQFLVSSRAGGEGLNLQVARRLVHVDVPWNPMELEQRVGRVHRFMSRRKVLVDTVVVKDSREVDLYRVAREKLRSISSTLVPSDRFESLFSRVMALVAPEDLLEIMAERPLGPLNDDEQKRLTDLVTEGFHRWKDFDEEYSGQQRRIRHLDPGQAAWDDVAGLARAHLKAKPVEGYRVLRFKWASGEVQEASEEALVFELGGRHLACGDYGGMPVLRGEGETADRLGLNHPAVAETIRELAFPREPAGAAHIRLPAGADPGIAGLTWPFGVLVLGRHSVRWTDGTAVESGTTLHVSVVQQEGAVSSVAGESKGRLIRTLIDAVQRQEAEPAPRLVEAMEAAQEQLVNELRRPSEAERGSGVAHGVFPLLAAICTK